MIFTTGHMLSETQTTSKRSQIVENMRTHHPEFSDIAPVNLFPRNTTSTASDYRWAFDTQSAGWEVHTNESHRLLFLTMCIYSDALVWMPLPNSIICQIIIVFISELADGL